MQQAAKCVGNVLEDIFCAQQTA